MLNLSPFHWRHVMFGALLGALLFAPTLGAQAAERYDALTPCELSALQGRVTTEALCGTLSVPENPNQTLDQADRVLDLAYAVLPARGTALEDPVFFLAGGPGQAARDVAPMMRRALRDIHRNRDLIFLDQRGTGGSNALNCVFDQATDGWLEPDPEAAIEQIDACRDEWDADVRFYTSTDAARDIDQLREHLGFEQINLIGGSYGTRMAQVYMKQYPDRVRSAILDGVVPMRLALGAEHGPSLDRALEKLIAACSEDAACQQAFPNLSDAFVELKNEYDSWTDGPRIQITHPRLGEAIEITFSRAVLATALRFLAYDPSTQMLLPYLIHEAATTGNPQRIAAQAMMLSEQMEDALALGLNFAVGCAEDWPQWPDTQEVDQTLLADSIGDLYAALCPDWPTTDVPADFNEPYSGDVPVLLLSGELDPVTPPGYGDEVDALTNNSLHLVANGRGHIVISIPCIARIAANFIDQASVADLDTSCMDTLGPEPFFTDLLGPTP